MNESAARDVLEQLVTSLLDAANDTAREGSLGGGRAVFWGRAVTLDAGVDKLLAVLLDHPDADIRAARLLTLYDVLDAAATIGGCLKTPIAAVQRLRIGPAEYAKLKESRLRDEVIVNVANVILQVKGRSQWSALRVSQEHHDFEEPLREQGLEPLAESTLYDRLRRLWPRIEASMPTKD
jgi:hypothetical protein